MEVFFALRVWGAYIWRCLFSEFYGSSSLNSCEHHLFQLTIAQVASFPGTYTIDEPRFQSTIPSNRWYIACNMGLEPIRTCNYFE